MEDIGILSDIFERLKQPDDNIRVPAEQRLSEIKKTNLERFVQTILAMLQNSDKFPPHIIGSALLYARQSFRSATKAKRSNDPTLGYLLISFDLTNAYLSVIFALFPVQVVSDYAAKLLGQIATYLLSDDPKNPVLSAICQQLPNHQVTAPCCTAIEYLFQEMDIDISYQAIVMSSVIPLFSRQDLSLEHKSHLISVVSTLIPSLPNFLQSPNDWQSFAQSMLSLTAVPELKWASYDFWDSASKKIPQIFEYVPNIIEISSNDITTPDQSEEVAQIILQFWQSLINSEGKEPGSVSPILGPAVPAVIPLLIRIAENIYNPEILDSDDDQYPHITAKECIFALSSVLPDLCMPILVQYANQFSGSENSAQREIALFCFTTCIDSYTGEDDEKWNAIFQQCIQFAIQRFGDPSIRVVSQAIKMVLSIVQTNPDLMDFSSFVQPLLSLMPTVLAKDAQEALSEIVTLPTCQNCAEVFDKLLSFDRFDSIDCALKILQKVRSAEFSQMFFAKCIALAEVLATDQTTIELLPLVLQMIVIMIDQLGQSALSFFNRLFAFMRQCYEQFQFPEALKAICAMVHISAQNVNYAVNQVIIQINNDGSYDMKLTAITSITLYLAKCDVSQFIHEIMRLLIQMLENPLEYELRVAVFEAVNALHSSFPPLLRPLFGRLIPLYGQVLSAIQTIAEEDEELALQTISTVLEAMKLLFLNRNEDDSFVPILIQMSLSGIQYAVQSPVINKTCMTDILDVLMILVSISPADTKQYISSNAELNQLFEEAKNDEDLSNCVNNLLSKIL